MTYRSFIAPTLILSLASLLACGGDDGGADPSGSDSTASGPGGGASSSSGGGGGGGASAGGCGAKVTIAFYMDASCTPGTEVGQRQYDTSLECFSWTAMGSNAEENSATRFQCYKDRLCYTQHPNTLDCGDGGMAQTDKEAKNAECIKEPAGKLYSKILGGNEGCPPAPAGFECPASASMMGTPGIAACMSQK